MEFKTDNINDAFTSVITHTINNKHLWTQESSRNGPVRMIDEPVTVTYDNPRHRVLHNVKRDANPFFHLMESIWMLAGSHNIQWLSHFNKRMMEFSDDGFTQWGAYGFRWRRHFDRDQLAHLIQLLKAQPTTRRAVLSMWDPASDNDRVLYYNGCKDVPCNTHIYFKIRNGSLDMTVCNRSNDLLWGMLGANAVHFSFLLEYIANSLGIQVGRYHQVTNNLHYYTEHLDTEDWTDKDLKVNAPITSDPPPLFKNPDHRKTFDEECRTFISRKPETDEWPTFKNPFLQTIAAPMYYAWEAHKRRDYTRVRECLDIVCDADWAHAGYQWMSRREQAWRDRNS